MTDNTNPTHAAPVENPEAQMEVRVNDRSAHTKGSRTITESDLAPQRAGIFANAKTKTGMVAQELTPETLIEIPTPSGKTMQVTIAAAERAGLIVKDAATGEYREAESSEGNANAEQVEQPATLPAEVEENLSQIVTGFKEMGVDHIGVVSRYLGSGDLLAPPAELGALAQRSNTPLADLQAAWVNAAVGLHTQACDVFTKQGLDPMEVMDWMETHVPPNRLNQVRLRHYAQGDLSGWKQIGNAFIQTKGMGRGAREASGAPVPQNAKVYRNAKGQEVIKVQIKPGVVTEVTTATAKRLGFI